MSPEAPAPSQPERLSPKERVTAAMRAMADAFSTGDNAGALLSTRTIQLPSGNFVLEAFGDSLSLRVNNHGTDSEEGGVEITYIRQPGAAEGEVDPGD